MNIPKILPTHSRWWPYIVLTAGLIVTVLCAVYVSHRADLEDKFRFYNQVNSTTGTIDTRLKTYITVLLGVKGLFDASDTVTREEFRTYVNGLDLTEKFSGIQGVGLLVKLTPEEVPLFNNNLNTEGYGNSGMFPVGNRSEYFVTQYLAPETKENITSLGYDMYSEVVRKRTIDLAIEEGKPVMTEEVSLIQDTSKKKQPGFIIYIPLYKSRNIPSSDRRNLSYGMIYSSFHIQELLEGIFNNKKNLEVAFRIYDGTKSENNLLYVSSEIKNYKPLLTTTKELNIAGEKWIITFSSLPSFEHSSEKNLLSAILMGGTIISILLFLLNFIQQRSREEAEHSASVISNSEQALQESNHRISSILNSITDGFIALDHHGKFTYINKAAARTLQRHPEQVLGKTLWEVLPELELTRFGKAYKESAKENSFKEVEDFYEPFKAWLSVRIFPSQTGLSIYFADMTEKHKLERQKDDFLGVASHELKTPVTSMKAYIQVLEKRFEHSDDTKSYILLSKINAQIDKLTGLIQDLLDITKFEAGKLSLRYEMVNLNDLIKQTVEEIQITTDRHTIQVEGTAEKPVYTDSERISQVLTNLLSNAIKYSPRADKIVIKIQQNKLNTTICVQDFGVGIAADMQSKVFDRFFRVSDTSRITYPGLGLGLYISSEIIKRLKGKIWLQSREGKGSSFFFSIPTHQE